MTAAASITANPTEVGRRLRELLGDRAHDDPPPEPCTRPMPRSRVLPGLVVEPADLDELALVARVCGEAGVPLTMRGPARASPATPSGPGVVVVDAAPDAHHRDRPGSPDRHGGARRHPRRSQRRRPARAARRARTPRRTTLHVGGMIANNACGSHSVAWGTTAQNIARPGRHPRRRQPAAGVSRPPSQARPCTWPTGRRLASLAAFTARHEALSGSEMPPWPRRVSGYALDWLLPERGRDVARALVGTEGTCAIVARATVRLVRPPARGALLVLGWPDDVAGADAVPALLSAGPFTVESLSDELLSLAHSSADAAACQRAEPGCSWRPAARRPRRRTTTRNGSRPRSGGDSTARTCGCSPARRSRPPCGASARTARATPRGSRTAAPRGPASRIRPCHPSDWAVPARPSRAAREHGLAGIPYGHFGEGCVHVRIGFGLDRPGGQERYERFMDAAADLVVAHGGYALGRARRRSGSRRAPGAPVQPGAAGGVRRVQGDLDPTGVLNPGVIVAAPPVAAGRPRAGAAAARRPARPGLQP